MLKERIKLGTPEGKQILSRSDFEAGIVERLERIQKEMFEAAKARRDANIRTDITTPEAFRAYFEQSNEWIEDGTSGKVAFVRGKWCGDPESEEILKAMKITIRCIPFDQSDSEGICLLTGKPAKWTLFTPAPTNSSALQNKRHSENTSECLLFSSLNRRQMRRTCQNAAFYCQYDAGIQCIDIADK